MLHCLMCDKFDYCLQIPEYSAYRSDQLEWHFSVPIVHTEASVIVKQCHSQCLQTCVGESVHGC